MSPEASDKVRQAVNYAFAEIAVTHHGNVHALITARVEAQLVRLVLSLNDDNQSEVARMLGINRNTVRKRMRQMGLLR